MMRWLLILLALPATAFAVGAPPFCPVTTGSITLTVSRPRPSGVSPFLAFFDATASTSSHAAHSNFQDIYFVWDFGDTSAISGGTQFWAYGATGQPRKNKATGPVAAHLYVLPIDATADTAPVAQVWAYDGTSVATCVLNVGVYAPSGVDGFPTTDTMCAYNSTLGDGCPSGAVGVPAATLANAFASFGSGKRVLLKCGDSFSGNYTILPTVTKASIGAYGGCENTGAGRPALSGTFTFQRHSLTDTITDLRISDLDLTTGNAANSFGSTYVGGLTCALGTGNQCDRAGNIQTVLYNINAAGGAQAFLVDYMSESGIIGSSFTCGGAGPQCVFVNFGENACMVDYGGRNSTTLYCGAASYDSARFNPVWYNAIMGNSFDGGGLGGGTGGRETFRASACRFCVVTNNIMANANTVGAVFKFHNGNTEGSRATWVGQYTEYNEISDNIFTGKSGGNKVELASQNDVTDERLRYSIFERNMVVGSTGANLGATKVFAGTASATYRNNVIYVGSGSTGLSDHQFMVSRRPNNTYGGSWPVTNVELYNNTCYMLATVTDCIGFVLNTGEQANQAGNNSFAQNNLFYDNGASGHSTVTNGGTGNTVANNSASPNLNPGMSNITGSFSSILDFRPSANASGASASVPNYFDAYQLAWGTQYQLGALSPAAP